MLANRTNQLLIMILFFLSARIYSFQDTTAQNFISKILIKKDFIKTLDYNCRVSISDSLGGIVDNEYHVYQKYVDSTKLTYYSISCIEGLYKGLNYIYNGTNVYLYSKDTNILVKFFNLKPEILELPELLPVLEVPYSKYNTIIEYEFNGINNGIVTLSHEENDSSSFIVKTKVLAEDSVLIVREYTVNIAKDIINEFKYTYTSKNKEVKQIVTAKIFNMEFDRIINDSIFNVDETKFIVDVISGDKP